MKDDQLELLVYEKPRGRGFSIAVAVSMVVHALIIVYLYKTYRPITRDGAAPPIARYVELIRQNPQFTEAPGPKVQSAPISAPFSNANREASAPKRTGENPTTRPGQGGLYVPSNSGGGSTGGRTAAPSQQAQQAARQPSSADAAAAPQRSSNPDTFVYRPARANAAGVNWRGAIREMGKVASLGADQQGIDFGNTGGEKGFAKDGPLSFESQWYDWGDYAESMVSRIRVNWYTNMPQLIQTGLKGVVTIRFTIHRDGRISDVTILEGSGVPPYDFAAKKAIELSSPLNPLPKDFPNATEHVTAMFFYNREPPNR